VLLKMGDRRRGERIGCSAGSFELTQQGGEVDAHRILHDRGLMQVGVGENLTQTSDIAVEVAFSAGLGQQSAQPRRSQLGSLRWRRGRSQDGTGIGAGQPAVEVGERDDRGWVEILEQVADLVADLLTRPYRVLLGASEHPNSLGGSGVGGQWSVSAGIGAHDVGQQHRVGGIGFGSRDRISGPVARSGQRVDRVDHPAGLAQSRHPQAAIGFDADRDRISGVVAGLGQQCQQRRETWRVIADPSAGHHISIAVDDGDIMMFSGPTDSTKQGQGVITPSLRGSAVTGGLTRRPNRRTLRSVISLAVRDSSTPQDFVLSKSSRLGNNHQEVNPATGSGNGIPSPPDRICRQARRSFIRRRTPGPTRHHLAADRSGTAQSTRPINPSLRND
jgi:hypothetical protein